MAVKVCWEEEMGVSTVANAHKKMYSLKELNKYLCLAKKDKLC